MNPALAFLTGNGTDNRHRLLSHYLRFNDSDWDGCHDIVQWAFPLSEPSLYNPHAPILTKEDVEAAHPNDLALAQLAQRNLLMDYMESIRIVYIPMRNGEPDIFRFWPTGELPRISPFSHQNLRFSRVLASLRLLKQHAIAEAFYAFLSELGYLYPDMINKDSKQFWLQAVST